MKRSKKLNKIISSVILATSILIVGNSCTKKNESRDEAQVSKTIEKVYTEISKRPTININAVIKATLKKLDSVKIDYSEDSSLETVEENVLKFACLSNACPVYDNNMNQISYLDAYQSVLTIDSSEYMVFIKYIDNDNELKDGYVFKNNIIQLPDTFIEVDISEQKLTMYINGEKALESFVVTGTNCISPTRTGYFYIYYKEENAILRGYDDNDILEYESYVDYWMPFDEGIGLHDAEYHIHDDGTIHGWRTKNEFGGQTYTYNGSHGCVNLDNETAEFIYENSEIGTRVLVHK